MMKENLYILILILVQSSFTLCFAQSTSIGHIRTYNGTLALDLNAHVPQQYIISEYGTISQLLSGRDGRFYGFQAQEYDADLGCYLFPSRIYDVVNHRFVQPDPESQYHSPYVFVGGDPVNTVDRDGNMGKPLVLFQEDLTKQAGMSASMADVMAEVPDAYYVPIGDFMNREFVSPSDWNGNVFIKGHMSLKPGNEITVQKTMVNKPFKPVAAKLDFSKTGKQLYVNMDARDLGRSLRQFSDEMDVPLKNVVAGGCKGSGAAEKIYEGITDGKELAGGRELTVAGLKPGKEASLVGRNSTEFKGRKGLSETRFYVRNKGDNVQKTIDHSEDGQEVVKGYHVEDVNGARVELPYASGEEFTNFVNARVPEQFADDFKILKGFY